MHPNGYNVFVKTKTITKLLLLTFLLSSCGSTAESSLSVEPSSEEPSITIESSEEEVSSEESILESSEESSEELSSEESSEESSSEEISSEEVSSEDPIIYYDLFDGVKVDTLPTILKEETDLHFDYDDLNYTLYYKIGERGTYQEVEKGAPVKIPYINSDKLYSYPMTTSVNPDPTGTGGADKCFSSTYNYNIYQGKKYVLSQKMPVLYLKLEAADESYVEKMYTYPLEKDYDLSSIPVVCLNGPYYNFFDYNEGFYNRIDADLKVRLNIEYFDASYDEYFFRETQAKLGGNWSKGYPQRTININFNKNNAGKKNDPVDAHVFKESTKENSDTDRLTNLTRFRLHNGGNCFEENTGYNDMMMHILMDGTHVSTTASRPSIVFLNGEYWGTMTIREHYSDVYFADNYDIKKDNVILYELQGGWKFDDGNDDNAEEYLNELLNFINDHDLSIDANYEQFIEEYIDVDSFIDLFICESYAANWDFVGNTNNLKMWRVDTPNSKNPYADGKWRFCLHDIDFACNGGNSTLFLSNADLASNPNHYKRFPMYNKLVRNKQFRMRFIERAQELLQTNLSAQNITNVLDSIYDETHLYKEQSQVRWGQNPSSYPTVLKNIFSTTKNWMINRTNTYMDALRSSLSTWGEIE